MLLLPVMPETVLPPGQALQDLRGGGGPRGALCQEDLQLLQETRLQYCSHGGQLQEHWRGDTAAHSITPPHNGFDPFDWPIWTDFVGGNFRLRALFFW